MANTHKAWRLHAHDDLRFEDVETPKPSPDGVLVRIEAGMVLSYMGRVLSGQVPYGLPPMPFVPGTNAIGRVIATGANVSHVQNGDRVFLSPHLRGDVPDSDPPQILIGLTTMATTQAALAMQARWRGIPFPLSLNCFPCWVPAGILILDLPPSIEGTSTEVPSAAFVNEIGSS